jgi:hypothetical protein
MTWSRGKYSGDGYDGEWVYDTIHGHGEFNRALSLLLDYSHEDLRLCIQAFIDTGWQALCTLASSIKERDTAKVSQHWSKAEQLSRNCWLRKSFALPKSETMQTQL